MMIPKTNMQYPIDFLWVDFQSTIDSILL